MNRKKYIKKKNETIYKRNWNIYELNNLKEICKKKGNETITAT